MSGQAFDRLGLAKLLPLFRELCDLKRVYVAHADGSIATRGFLRAWDRLVAGEDANAVAFSETAASLAAARLAGIDDGVLADCGLTDPERTAVLAEAIREVGQGVSPSLMADLEEQVGAASRSGRSAMPDALLRLARQPRAGATRPGRARISLEPAENHAEHCYITAIYGVLAGPLVGVTEPGPTFVAALAHHFHNAYLPDGGFTGEMLLGSHLEPVIARLTDRTLATLDDHLAGDVRSARDDVLGRPFSPGGMAFQIGDVLDRVLQIEHYATVASFELRHALDDLELVHAGPLQAMQNDILAAAGLPSHAHHQPAERTIAAA